MDQPMFALMYMSCLFLDHIGSNQDVMGIIIIMSPPNDLTVGMGGRTTLHKANSEAIRVEEMVDIVEATDKAFQPE